MEHKLIGGDGCEARGTPALSRPIVITRRFRDSEEVGEAIDEAQSTFTQISAGPFVGETTLTRLGSFTAVRTRTSPLTLNATRVTGGSVVFHLPISWQGDLLWSGEPVGRPTLLFHRPGDEFVRRARNLYGFAFGWDCDEFDRDLAALSGLEADEVRVRTRELSTLSVPIPALAGACERLFSRARKPANDDQVLAAHRAMRYLTQIVLRSALSAIESRSRVKERGRRDASRIVLLAEEYFEQARPRAISLAELCRAAGVSARKLQYAFECVCGLPPMRYFKLRRLSAARAALRASPPWRGTVKAAAIDAGYLHFGRFTSDYRSLFGEAPSETLAGGTRMRLPSNFS